MPRAIPTLQAFNLRKTYMEGPVSVHAVKGASLTARGGSVVVLMGPSGSGKTTLLSMLGCLLTPSAGELRLMGKQVRWEEPHLSTVRRHQIGFVFQHYNLLSALTALENVMLAFRFRGIRDEAKQSRALLERFGLGHRCAFMPRDLSGGEKQRVAIARAVAGNPPLLLADEPTGNLDSKSGRIVTSLLKDMAIKENRLIVIVSHDIRVVEYADEVVFLEDGVLRQAPFGPREHEVRREPTLRSTH